VDDIAVRHFTASRRTGEKPYDIIKIDGKGRRIEVAVSSTGRAVHVWLDGEHMEARRG
jgi:hypothetical protein